MMTVVKRKKIIKKTRNISFPVCLTFVFSHTSNKIVEKTHKIQKKFKNSKTETQLLRNSSTKTVPKNKTRILSKMLFYSPVVIIERWPDRDIFSSRWKSINHEALTTSPSTSGAHHMFGWFWINHKKKSIRKIDHPLFMITIKVQTPQLINHQQIINQSNWFQDWRAATTH